MDLTETITSRNVDNVRFQIIQKKQSNPYFSTVQTNKNALTDMDIFPYPRFFRGQPTSDVPIVMEREAGWRPINEECYKPSAHNLSSLRQHDIEQPRHFFQPPCSTVYPKYVSLSDISFDNIKLNENCVMSYR